MNQNAFPDIEIYLKRVETADILAWLGHFFEIRDTDQRGKALICALIQRSDSQALECAITDKVAKGGYVSVWFKQNHTPWPTDVACARAAFEQFGGEVRCSQGGWDGEDSEEAGGWLRITDKGEQTVNWFE